MVQREIKNKARLYGAVGIFSAMILVAMIYSFGAAPQILNQDPMPSAMPSGTPPEMPPVNAQASPLQTFTSYQELTTFLTGTTSPNNTPSPIATPMPTQAPTLSGDVAAEGSYWSRPTNQEKSYSTTNIQVAGVDEADTVKTDGTYLYVIANNTVYVLDAGTTNIDNAKVIAKIENRNNTYISGIYLSQNGNKLAVIGNEYRYHLFVAEPVDASIIKAPYYGSGLTFVEVYDVSNKASPVLSRNLTMSGYYANSRMIDDYIYTVITETVQVKDDGSVNLPTIFENSGVVNIDAKDIFYIPRPDSYYTYTTIISLNIMDDSQAFTNTTIMASSANEIYVSAENIYLISPTWDSESQYITNIYRVSINQGSLSAQAEGTVWGTPINSYAMDEYNGYFRIATTKWFMDNATTRDGAEFKISRQMNSLYVLNSNLDIVGKLEGFKMDENLYAVRFLGDKCYAVTFKIIDPFYVIDLSNPTAPKVAGELKIPGYSSYLYPIDNTHLIGIGKENSTLKLSIFDVSNINAPAETARYIVEGSYTDSSATYEPHAFLYNPETQQLVIPVSLNNYQVFPLDNPENSRDITTTSTSYWQGVYIFKVDTSTGFTLQGKITQIDNVQKPENEYWVNYNLEISRSLYIDNTLYTISNSRVQLNSLNDFSLLAKINLD